MANKEIKIHSIKYNFLMNIIMRVSQLIFPLVTFPYISRVLLNDNNGKIAFATAVVSYLTLVSSLGIPTYGIKICAQKRDDKEQLSKTVQELFVLNIIFLIASIIIFGVLLYFVPSFYENRVVLMIISTGTILNVIGVEWFYQAIEQYDYITKRNIVFKIASLILMFIFVHKPEDYIVYSCIMVFGSYGSYICNFLKLKSYVLLKFNLPLELKQHLKPIFFLFLYSAATQIYTNLDTVMLGFITNDYEVSLYNVAVKVKLILVSLITALGTVLLPRASYYLKTNREKYNDILNKAFCISILCSLPCMTFFIIEASDVIMILAGSNYLEAVIPMQLILISLLPISLSSITAWQVLIPMEKNMITVGGAVIGGLIDFSINLVLIDKIGSSGAAIGTIVAEFLVLIIHIFGIWPIFKENFDGKDVFKIFVTTIVSGILCVLVRYLYHINNPFIGVSAIGVLFFATFLIILLVTKEKTAIWMFELIRGKIQK